MQVCGGGIASTAVQEHQDAASWRLPCAVCLAEAERAGRRAGSRAAPAAVRTARCAFLSTAAFCMCAEADWGCHGSEQVYATFQRMVMKIWEAVSGVSAQYTLGSRGALLVLVLTQGICLMYKVRLAEW